MSGTFDLARFIEAQNGIYDAVIAELARGKKESHWMWFVFPQMAGLAKSSKSQFYGIKSLDEARAYLNDPVLGTRLRECTRIVNTVRDRTAHEIFGTTDEMKFRSCMTLFSRISTPSVFTDALEKYFDGGTDPETLTILAKGPS